MAGRPGALDRLLIHAGAIPPPASDFVVNFGDRRTYIDGFGGADRNVGKLTTAQADLFFNPVSGIGLSLLRRGIEVDGTPSSDGTNTDLYANAIQAAARGAKIVASPWSAPGALKSNGSDINGGHLLSANYSTWATTLAGVQAAYQSNAGVNLYALGVQNEPDITAGYETMLYTDAEMVAFLKVLGPLVAALSPPPKILAPESSDWGLAATTMAAIEADDGAAQYVTFAGAHQYAGVPVSLSAVRRTWQTEMSGLQDVFDTTITHGLTVAGWIHAAMVAGASAWFYWELNGQSTDNEGLIGQNSDFTITKRLYTMGNFSKFIRPGYYRVASSGTLGGVSLSAYVLPSTKQLVLVAINANGSPQAMAVYGAGVQMQTMTPYTTSSTLNLAQQSDVVAAAGLLSVTLPASSVTTFVGRGI